MVEEWVGHERERDGVIWMERKGDGVYTIQLGTWMIVMTQIVLNMPHHGCCPEQMPCNALYWIISLGQGARWSMQ